MHANIKEIRKAFQAIECEIHEHPSFRFLAILLIFIIYITFSIIKFGGEKGLLVSFLTWSFFVLCTPIADAGVLLDFPIRMITGLKMVYSEIFVWVVAISLNIYSFTISQGLYDSTLILKVFHNILIEPFPYYSIIILSGIGTFLSVLFGDELIDLSYGHKNERTHHKSHHLKYKIIAFIILFIFIFVIYDLLLHHMNIEIPLI